MPDVRCACGEPYCRTCGSPVDGPYTPATACPHPEPASDTNAWDAWLDSHPWTVTAAVGRVCAPLATKEAA